MRLDSLPSALPQSFNLPSRLPPAGSQTTANGGPTLVRYAPEPTYNPSLQAALPPTTAATQATPSTFGIDARGQQPQAVDLDLMALSNASYTPATTRIGEWTRLDDAQLTAVGIDPSTLENADTGFRAGIYQNADGDTVLAFAGSNERQDWTQANIPQGLGWQTEQFDQAVQLAQQADVAFGDSLVITGHSLGGGLAATAAFATDRVAVTFNASGVNDNTIERLGLDPAAAKAEAESGQIRRYNISGEILTGLQEDVIGARSLLPDAPGHEINLSDPAPPRLDTSGPFWDQPGHLVDFLKAKAERPLQLHAQQSVIDALEQQRPWQ